MHSKGLSGVQGLRFCAPNTWEGPGFEPWSGTRSHMSQLRVHMPQQRSTIACAKTKTQFNQIKVFNIKKKNTHTPMYIAALSTTAKTRKEPKWPSIDD